MKDSSKLAEANATPLKLISDLCCRLERVIVVLCFFVPVSVLQRCDPALLAPCGDPEQPDGSEAAAMVLYLTVSWPLPNRSHR